MRDRVHLQTGQCQGASLDAFFRINTEASQENSEACVETAPAAERQTSSTPAQIHGAVKYLHKAQESLEKMPHYPAKQWAETDHVRRAELRGSGTSRLGLEPRSVPAEVFRVLHKGRQAGCRRVSKLGAEVSRVLRSMSGRLKSVQGAAIQD